MRGGVVGVGYMGSIHARALARLGVLEGVYDLDKKRAEEVARKYGARAFGSLDEMLERIDFAVCATPTETHLEVGKRILEAGVHLLMEKPLADTLEASEVLVSEAEKRGLALGVGYIERFNQAIKSAERFLKKPMYVDAQRLAPFNSRGTDVDVITDLMVHDIDLALLYIGEEPVSLQCVGVPVLTDKIDIANARLEFPSGAVASLTASRVSMQKYRKIRFFQRDAYISVDLLKKEVELVLRRDGEILPYFPDVPKAEEPIYLQDKAFLEAILKKEKPPVSGEEALKTTRLAYLLVEDALQRLKRAGF